MPDQESVLIQRFENWALRRNPNASVTSGFLQELSALGTPRACQYLLSLFRDSRFEHMRIHAAMYLGDQKFLQAVDPLSQMLAEDSIDVTLKSYIANALGKLSDRRALPHITEWFHSFVSHEKSHGQYVECGLRVCDALAKLGTLDSVVSEFATATLVSEAKHGHNFTVWTAARSVCRDLGRGNEDITKVWVDILSTCPHSTYLNDVAHELSWQKWPKSTAQVVAVEMARQNFKLVEGIGPEATEGLIELLGHPCWKLRGNACIVLAKIGDQRCIASLQMMAADMDGRVRDDAEKALNDVRARTQVTR